MTSDPALEEGQKAFINFAVPQTPLDVAMFAFPYLKGIKAATLAGGAALTSSEAQAGTTPAVEMAPTVGFSPTMLLRPAGMRERLPTMVMPVFRRWGSSLFTTLASP